MMSYELIIKGLNDVLNAHWQYRFTPQFITHNSRFMILATMREVL